MTRGDRITEITCENCGSIAPKRGNGPQKYCETCSEEMDRKRKKTWSQRNPLTKAQLAHIQDNRRGHKSEVLEAWSKKNAEHRKTISWMADGQPDLEWLVRISVPFLYRMSKNAIFATNRFGHVALRREAKAIRHEITILLKEAMQGVEIKKNKVWIDLLVQKPNHRGDAINVLDLVCDAIKDAIGVDDRWFAIRRIDWQVVKDDPKLFIGVGQEECEHSLICSGCGQILANANFPRNASAKEGISRVCTPCRKLQRATQRKARDAAQLTIPTT